MRMHFIHRLFIPLFLLGIFLLGCIDNPTTNDRLSCLKLSTYNSTSIPKCTAQDECFAKVQASFSFSDSEFEPPVRKYLFEAKDRLSRSWLFLSSARKNLDSIRSQCSAADYSGIPRHANELNSNLQSAAEEIDYFNKSAASAINAQLTVLEFEDVNAMPEERVFDDYVLLNQNALDFSQKNISGNTYAARYQKEYGKFSAVARSLGLQSTLQETSLFQIVSDNKSAIFGSVLAGAALEHDFPIAILKPIFGGFADFIADYFSLGGSVQSLNSIPSSEIFSALDGMAGQQNSAASAFFGIFSSESANIAQLKASNSAREQKVASMAGEARGKIPEISALLASYSQLPEYFPQYGGFMLVDSQSGPTPKEFSETYAARAEALDSALRSLRQQEYLGTATLGRTTSVLKGLELEAESLLSGMQEFSTIESDSASACSSALSGIRERLSSSEFSSGNPAITSLSGRVIAEISSYNDTGEFSSCTAALQDFSRLLSYMDEASPEEKTAGLISACFAEAESLLQFGIDGDASVRLDSMKRIQRPYANPELVLSSCQSLTESLLLNGRENESVKKSETDFALLAERAGLVSALAEKFPSLPSSSRAASLASVFAKMAGNFSDGRLKSENLASAQAISREVSGALENANSLLPEISSDSVQKYALVERPSPSLGIFRPDADQNRMLAVSFDSIPKRVPAEFSVSFPFSSEGAANVFSTGNVSFAPSGSRTAVYFSSLLPGKNYLILDLNPGAENPSTAREGAASTVPFNQQGRSILSEMNSLINGVNARGLQIPEDANVRSSLIELLVKERRISEASRQLALFKEDLNAESDSQGAAKAEAEEFASMFAELRQLQASVAKNTQELLGAFAKLTPRELEEISPLLPITEERAKGLQAASQKTLSISSAEFTRLLKKGQYAEAVAKAKATGIEAALASLRPVAEESSAALRKAKENALASFENAKLALQNSGKQSQQAAESIAKAKAGLEEKSYFKSILESARSASLIPVSGAASLGAGFEIPVAVYPLLLVLGVAGFLAVRKPRQEKPKEPVKIRKAAEDETAEPTLS